MSRRNVEIVARMYDTYERGDFPSSLACLDPEIEVSQPSDEPGGGTFHGHEGVVQAFAAWAGGWGDSMVEVEELTDCGDQVLARTSPRGRGKGSGAEVELEIFQLWTLRDDKPDSAPRDYDQVEELKEVERSDTTHRRD